VYPSFGLLCTIHYFIIFCKIAKTSKVRPMRSPLFGRTDSDSRVLKNWDSDSDSAPLPVANPPNCAQLGGIPYHSPKLHPGQCNSAGMRPRTDTQTDIQTRVITIHFASSTTHTKCNKCNDLRYITTLYIYRLSSSYKSKVNV